MPTVNTVTALARALGVSQPRVSTMKKKSWFQPKEPPWDVEAMRELWVANVGQAGGKVEGRRLFRTKEHYAQAVHTRRDLAFSLGLSAERLASMDQAGWLPPPPWIIEEVVEALWFHWDALGRDEIKNLRQVSRGEKCEDCGSVPVIVKHMLCFKCYQKKRREQYWRDKYCRACGDLFRGPKGRKFCRKEQCSPVAAAKKARAEKAANAKCGYCGRHPGWEEVPKSPGRGRRDFGAEVVRRPRRFCPGHSALERRLEKPERLCDCGCGLMAGRQPNNEPRKRLPGHGKTYIGHRLDLETGKWHPRCLNKTTGRVSIGRRQAEHRWVMERKLGRKLKPHEQVHHIDRDPLNNEPENLELRIGHHGTGAVYACCDCGSDNIKAVPIGSQEKRRRRAKKRARPARPEVVERSLFEDVG